MADWLGDIRSDHVARYMWASDYVRGKAVHDFGCGCGYGTSVLAQAAHCALGIDNCSEIIDFARKVWDWPGIDTHFVVSEARHAAGVPCQVAVAFELLEHMADQDVDEFLKELQADTLLVSVPNEDEIPYRGRLPNGDEYVTLHHQRHYTPAEFGNLLTRCGWHVSEKWYQADELAPVRPITPGEMWHGRTLVAVCRRLAPQERVEIEAMTTVRAVPNWGHPTARARTHGVPETVALIALGPSRMDYLEAITRHEYQGFDEVWTVNTGLRYIKADLVWKMDDLDFFADRFPQYGRDLEQCPVPIITSKAYPHRFPQGIEYPLQQVIDWCGHQAAIFHDNSIPYALAYAGFIGVKTLVLYGCDYSYPNLDRVEAGREVTTHWVGFLKGRGMQVAITESSSLLQTYRRVRDPEFRPFYGYLRPPIV